MDLDRAVRNAQIALLTVSFTVALSLLSNPIERYQRVLRELHELTQIYDVVIEDDWYLNMVQDALRTRSLPRQDFLSRGTVASFQVGDETRKLRVVTDVVQWFIHAPRSRAYHGYNPRARSETWRETRSQLLLWQMIELWNGLAEPHWVLWPTAIDSRGKSFVRSEDDPRDPTQWTFDTFVSFENDTVSNVPPLPMYLWTSEWHNQIFPEKIGRAGAVLVLDNHVPRRPDSKLSSVWNLFQVSRVISVPCPYVGIRLRPQEELRRLGGATWSTGDFATSFPSLSEFAREVPYSRLDGFENLMQRVADQARPNVRLLGADVPGERVAQSGVILIVLLQLYLMAVAGPGNDRGSLVPETWSSRYQFWPGRLFWWLCVYGPNILLVAALRSSPFDLAWLWWVFFVVWTALYYWLVTQRVVRPVHRLCQRHD